MTVPPRLIFLPRLVAKYTSRPEILPAPFRNMSSRKSMAFHGTGETSHKSYTYEGFGTENEKNYWYRQAVRTGDFIHISGQGGWDPDTGEFKEGVTAQIDQAFANVELVLKTAGGKGWSQVYRVSTFLTVMSEEHQQAIVRNFKKYAPDHHITWTNLGVTALGVPPMLVEVEVSAYDPQGTKAGH